MRAVLQQGLQGSVLRGRCVGFVYALDKAVIGKSCFEDALRFVAMAAWQPSGIASEERL